MVSGFQSPLPPTITVLPEQYRGRMSLRQLAKDLNANRRNLKRAKNWLIENRHPSFEGYMPDSLLSSDQANAIILYRSYTTAGIKGDALTTKMFPDIATAHDKKNALRDLFEQHHIPPEQAAQLTHTILEIFKS
jgi:signal transduction histidine kinase